MNFTVNSITIIIISLIIIIVIETKTYSFLIVRNGANGGLRNRPLAN